MMNGSTGGERQLRSYEGLVLATARMWALQVHREEDDLAQELRVRAWRAMESWDPVRSDMTCDAYVFQALANKIKDYKRDAAREAKRRADNEIGFLHIEDVRTSGDDGTHDRHPEKFDALFLRLEREEVYGRVEGELFVLPANVTDREANVLLLLMMDMTRAEIALRLALGREEVAICVVALRRKFADWKPSHGESRENSSPTSTPVMQDAAAA